MVAYARREDVYLRGLPRGSLAARPRVVASVDVASNRLEIEGHGCELDTQVQLRTDGDGELPAPLSPSTVYFARPVSGSDSLLELAATAGGAAIDLTTAGADPIMLLLPIGPLLDALSESYSRWIDSLCPAHAVPFETPPAWVTQIVATRTAAQAARALGLGAQADGIFTAETQAIADAMRLATGIPLRDAAAGPSLVIASGRTPSSCRLSREPIP